jgi:hypothetical protein
MIIKRSGARLNMAEGIHSVGFHYERMTLQLTCPERNYPHNLLYVELTELELQNIVEYYRKERGQEAFV